MTARDRQLQRTIAAVERQVRAPGSLIGPPGGAREKAVPAEQPAAGRSPARKGSTANHPDLSHSDRQELGENRGQAFVRERLDVDRVTFRLGGGQLRIDGQPDPLELTSLVQLEAMVQAAIRQKRKELWAR